MSDNIHHITTHEGDAVVVNPHDNEYYPNDNKSDADMMEEYAEKPAAPRKRPFYKTKRYWIICSIVSAIIIIVVVLLALFVFFPLIAQSLMNGANINVDAAQITFTKPDALNGLSYRKRDGDDLNSTFYMNMQSTLSNTGPFSASIKYHNPVEVYYKDQVLGNIFLFNDSSISGGHGQLNAITPFLIQDVNQFASFAKDMLALQTFTWTLKGKLDITALSRTATVNLDKDITLNGMDGFPNVKINSFQLPGDDPNGGIIVELGTILTSPSPIGIQLGTINLAIGYDGIGLGDVKADNVNLQQGDNNILLKGTLVPQTDPTALDKVGTLFSNYVAGKVSNTSATGISVAPNGVNPIGWLSQGFETVKLNVALGAAEPLNIIKSVNMGYLDLKFDQANPYSPIANAPSVNADFQIPFGFTLNITEVTQNISLALNTSGTQTTDFATIQVLNTPAISDQKAGTLKFAINNDAIAGIPGQESVFNQYTYALTASDNYTFMVAGNASTKTMTPIGPITLGGISFMVPTTLHGLQFLNSSATIINSLDVTGGTSDALLLAINVTMTNPADFSISTGNVSFIMGASGTNLGVVTLNNLYLARGPNTVMASATFNPKISDVGQNLLSSFVMGKDNAVEITGYQNSTIISSLANALSAINLGSTLPGLKTALIQGGALTVLSDTPKNGVVGVKVSISNPFSAGLSITQVTAAATFAGIPIGNINQDISTNPFVIPGKATAQSQDLNMNMNIEPASVALLLRTLAVQANLDTRSLDALLGLGGFQIAGQQDISPDSSLFANFNISSYVLDAMKALKVDLSLSSGLDIGQYTDTLAFSQNDVQIATDNTVLILIPIVGQPIVQQIVDGAVLAFDSIILSAPTDTTFTVEMKGSITKSGPMDAAISFPAPLNIAWQGKTIGSVSMPTINAKANVGAQFDVTAQFSIANQDDMAEFSAYLINNNDFVWDITTQDVAVTALGYTFTNITMEKFVTLLGAQGFKNAVTINSFNLPSNDAAGGITLVAQTIIKNPSQIGFNLAGVGFETFFQGTDLGPLASNGAAVFPPQGVANINMTGRLIPQTSTSGLAAITEVFENYLNANYSLLDVKGVSGSGPNGVVGWLSKAFQTLTIDNVVLPGPTTKPELIPAITLKDMTLDFTKDPWAPPTSSNNVEAQLKNPFGFPLGVSQLNMNAEATYQGLGVATLAVPNESASTSSTGLVSTQFSNVPFNVEDKTLFTGFVQLLTLSPSITFGLQGSSNAITDTAVGALSLKNIDFNVQTTLSGFADFGGQATIKSLDVVGGTSQYVIINLTFDLTNPSNITISVGDINFDVVMNEFNTVIGRVYLTNTVIPYGTKTYSAVLHLGEGATNSNAISQTLGDYLTSAAVPLTIQGSSQSTTIPPLGPALASVKLASTMTGIAGNLIDSIQVQGTLIGFIINSEAQAQINLKNPLDTSYSIKSVQASVTFKPSTGAAPFEVGTISYELPSPVTVPAKGSTQTNPWPVKISGSGLGHYLQMLEMLGDPNKYFDVQQNVTVIVGDGYNSAMYYYQNKVPFSITIDGISTSSIPSLPSSVLPTLESITDQSQLQQVLIALLTGKNPFAASSSAATNSTSTTIVPSNILPNVVSAAATVVTTTITPTAITTTEQATTATTTTTVEATTTTTATATSAGGISNILPF